MFIDMIAFIYRIKMFIVKMKRLIYLRSASKNADQILTRLIKVWIFKEYWFNRGRIDYLLKTSL